jgi:hypothetical protein
MERNMALIGFVQLYFKQQVHKETWVGLAVKMWGSIISCAGALPIAQQTRARKHQHKHVI